MPIHATATAWVLETNQTAYVLGLNAKGMLVHCYWGVKLPRVSDYPVPAESEGWSSFNAGGGLLPEEFPTYAGAKYIEPCLKLTFADGVRDTVLEFDSAKVEGNELQIHLRDTFYALRITLHYHVLENVDLLERFVTVHNQSDTAITVERFFSAQFHPPLHSNYRLHHLAGAWLKETQVQHETLGIGTKVLESRRITTGHQHQPWFALDNLEQPATETTGHVWFAALAWSGNWKLTAEKTIFGGTRVSLGLNDWDFALRLEAKRSFSSPKCIAGFSSAGFGAASRAFHGYVQTILPHPEITRKVLYNSWEATAFHVNEADQVKLAEIAKGIGVELFVLDDGWFHNRHSDNAALGDWWADKSKFPNGLNPLIEKVNALGMDFGLWLEPEMVSVDSELYHAHPDWVIHFPTRARTEMRNQLMLNLAKSEVQDYLIGILDKLLEQHNITFIKWDMNRNVSEPGWLEHHEPKEIWLRYVEGLYRVWGTLRQRHPDVIWQSCSGGGGRADLGILQFADQIWISDMTEPTMRLRIQEGYSQIYPANTMEAWVTDMGAKHLPLEFRFHVSMAGLLGIGTNLHHWSETEIATATRLVQAYKTVRHVIQFGNQYRLRSVFISNFSSLMYVTKDQSEAVIFAFRTHIPDPVKLPAIHLQGLEPTTQYEINGTIRSGSAWQHVGLEVNLTDFSSVMLHIKRVEP